MAVSIRIRVVMTAFLSRMRDEMFRRGAMRLPGMPPHDPYLEASRRHAAAMGQGSPYGQMGDRMMAERAAVERMALGSLATDPLVRLQMAGINPEVGNLLQPPVVPHTNFDIFIVNRSSSSTRCPRTPTPTSTCTPTPPRLWASQASQVNPA